MNKKIEESLSLSLSLLLSFFLSLFLSLSLSLSLSLFLSLSLSLWERSGEAGGKGEGRAGAWRGRMISQLAKWGERRQSLRMRMIPPSIIEEEEEEEEGVGNPEGWEKISGSSIESPRTTPTDWSQNVNTFLDLQTPSPSLTTLPLLPLSYEKNHIRFLLLLHLLLFHFRIFLRFFLDAFSHLYERVCPSVRRSVRPPSVGHTWVEFLRNWISGLSLYKRAWRTWNYTIRKTIQRQVARTHLMSELCQTCSFFSFFCLLSLKLTIASFRPFPLII